MLTCRRCTAITHDDAALFCGSCGASLQEPAESSPSTLPRPDLGPAGPLSHTIPGEPISAALQPEPPHPEPAAPPPAAEPPHAQPAPPAGAPRAKPFSPPKHLAPGTLIDKKYAVLRVLGEGGMGVVYLARDIHTGLDVVVKAVRSELSHREDVRARTLAEGRALAQIDHPNVVHLRAVAVDGPNLFLVMQYIEGESLDKIIARHVERGEPMPVEEALAIFRQVAAGVGAAHEEGVIHRDLKPANVIVRRKDKVAKVTDFGIALVPGDTSRPQTRGILGSLWYMSPEQVKGKRDLDQRVDVYALGIMLYQMLVGRVPFDAKSDYEIMKLHAEAPMPRVGASRQDVPPPVDDLIQTACAKDRNRRFQRCEDVVAAVDRLFGVVLPPGAALPSATASHAALSGLALPYVPEGSSPAGPTPNPAIAVPMGPRAAPYPGPAEPALGPSAPTSSGRSTSLPIPLVPVVTVSTASTSGPVLEEPVVPARRRGKGLWVVLGVLVLAGGGAGAAYALGLFGGPHRTTSNTDAGVHTTKPAPAVDAGAAKGGLDALAGAWVGNGRELQAVVTGNEIEFRVKKPEQFAPQGYDAGEARFVLRATAEPNVFTVEDRIRPVPPTGKTYDARARGTCQEVWTSVGGDPLRARYEGGRLTVEFAKIEPGAGNFTLEGSKVTSCVGLRKLKPSKVVSALVRP